MPEIPSGRANRWLTVLTIEPEVCGVTVPHIIDALDYQNIEARSVLKPLHLQPVFKNTTYYAHKPGESISERFFQRGVCLPSGSNLGEQDQEQIIACMKKSLQCLSN
jgi:pyridoxal phosphate-dependent aminotransferase EpsN